MNSNLFEISAATKVLSVIGDPIHHSMSPTMHNAAIKDLNLDYTYVAFQVTRNNLKSACNGFRSLGICGINVTIPHKIEIMQFMDEIDPIAQGIGAINTIKNIDGKLIARNTDGEGMIMSLIDAGFSPKNKKSVILGAGGASRAISFMLGTTAEELVLTDLYPEAAEGLKQNLNKFYSQSDIRQKLGYEPNPLIKTIPLKENAMRDELKNTDLLVNASPVGMYPNTNASPLDGMNLKLDSSTFVFDAVYNPLETKFLIKAKKAGCKTLSGINMLVNQGVAAFEWWTGRKPNSDLMLKTALKKLNL